MDLAATKIAYVDGDPKNGALVTVEARDKLVMPVTLRVVFADGSKKDMRLPAETWIRQAATAVPVGGISKIVSATLDPTTSCPTRIAATTRLRVSLWQCSCESRSPESRTAAFAILGSCFRRSTMYFQIGKASCRERGCQ